MSMPEDIKNLNERPEAEIYQGSIQVLKNQELEKSISEFNGENFLHLRKIVRKF